MEALNSFHVPSLRDRGPSSGEAGPLANPSTGEVGLLGTEIGPSSVLPNLQVKLFKDLYSFWHQTSGAKILLNIQVAAIHLSFMIFGSNPNETLVSFDFYIQYDIP